jgi:hypothetical protein
MSNVIEEYLVRLGASYDAPSFQKFEQVLRDVAAKVDSRALEMAASLLKWQVAATTAFVAIAASAVEMAGSVAAADQEYRLFGLTMYMNADAAKKLKITMDALGQPLGMIAWDKELSDRADRLEKLQDTMEGGLNAANFEENMIKARELRFQVTQMEVSLQYLKQSVMNGLLNAFGPQIDLWIDKLQRFNDWFADHLPEITEKINKHLVPILKAVWRVLKDTGELLGNLAVDFADVIDAFSGDEVDKSLPKWERFAVAIEHCANAVAWLLEKLIAIEKFLSPNAATITGTLTGAKLGSFFGPEGTLIGAGVGAVAGGGLDLWRGHRKATYEGGAEPTGDAQATAQQAAALAQRVSAKTGIAPDLLWSQWAHETGGFKHLGGTNNLAGVNIPGGHGKDYRNFSSLDEFGDYYANMMRPGGRYSGIEQATSPEDFAGRLKQGGYYADTQSNYTAGVERWDKQYQKSYGDDSQAVTIGSVNVHINQPNASPQEVQARVSAGVLDGLRTATQRNLLEFQGAFA